MIERTLYRCEYCNTDYARKSIAEECERIHKKLTKIEKFKGIYESVECVPDGAPIVITIQFEGDDKLYTYRR